MDIIKLSNPSELPTNNALGTAFSPDGNYLSVCHYDSPFITIYKRSGDTFTKLPNPSTLPTGNGYGTAFSPDGNYLSVADSASPYITIYKSRFRDYLSLHGIKLNTEFQVIYNSSLTYLNIQSSTQQQFQEWGMKNFVEYGVNLSKVSYEMDEVAITENGRILSQQININDFEINSMEVK